MSVVKINVLDVPAAMGDTLLERFRSRAGEVEKMPGFEGFELLRPTDDSGKWFVYTRWATEADFEAWVSSREFQKGHAGQGQPDGPGGRHPGGGHPGGGHPGGEGQAGEGHGGPQGQQRPAATGSELLGFDVVLSASPSSDEEE